MHMRTTDARDETVSSARTFASILGGRTLRDAPGCRKNSTNPARTDEGYAVMEVSMPVVGPPETSPYRAIRTARR